jgi:hypothetical protein
MPLMVHPLNEKKDRLEELIEFLRERESKDLDLFIDILSKLITNPSVVI